VALVVAAQPLLTTLGRRIGAALVIGAVSSLLLDPMAKHLSSLVEATLASFAGTNWCELPYGWKMNVPAYLSFAEPVAAAFTMAALACDTCRRTRPGD
jgi:hypothetical protein